MSGWGLIGWNVIEIVFWMDKYFVVDDCWCGVGIVLVVCEFVLGEDFKMWFGGKNIGFIVVIYYIDLFICENWRGVDGVIIVS